MHTNRAFSLIESMMSLLIMSIIIMGSMPLISQMSIAKSGLDKSALSCVTSAATDIAYNTTTGAATMPASGTNCYTAISKSITNTGSSYNTLKYYA